MPLRNRHLDQAGGKAPAWGRRLSFTLAAGDHVGLVRPNGSGKSTLLRIVAGSEEPDAGERIARKGDADRPRIEDPVFAPRKAVEEEVVEALAAQGLPRRRHASTPRNR